MVYLQSTKIQALLVFLASLFVFTIGFHHQEFIAFETRFAVFAQEMLRHGVSLFPTTYGQPYPDYPVLPTFFIYLSAHLFDGVNKLSAIFPTALVSAITLAFTYLIGALHDKKWGFYAVLFGLLTFTFIQEARTISMDQYVTMTTCVTFYLAYSSNLLNKKKRVWFIPFLLIFSFFCRGPIGLIIPASVLCLHYLIDKNLRAFIFFALSSFVILCLGTTLLMLAAYHTAGSSFANQVWAMEIFSRLEKSDIPLSFYFINSLSSYAITYPIAILILLGLFNKTVRQTIPKDHFLLLVKLITWIFIIMIGMSIPGDKKIRYILAISPALFLMAGYLFSEHTSSHYFILLKKLLARLIFILPLIALAILIIAIFTPSTHAILMQTPTIPLIIGLIIVNLINFFVRNITWSFLAAVLTFILTILFVVEPINLYLYQERDFVNTVEILRKQNHATLIFYQLSSDGEAISYLVNVNEDIHPIFIDNLKQLASIKDRAYIVTSQDAFDQLPKKIREKTNIIAQAKSMKEPIAFIIEKNSVIPRKVNN
jgi:4-amino-4-deoxy-L-arabinose transferase-like glycosyltransferase